MSRTRRERVSGKQRKNGTTRKSCKAKKKYALVPPEEWGRERRREDRIGELEE